MSNRIVYGAIWGVFIHIKDLRYNASRRSTTLKCVFTTPAAVAVLSLYSSFSGQINGRTALKHSMICSLTDTCF